MDISKWTELNPAINVVRTNSKFYNRYPYKISYYIFGAFVLSYAKNTTEIHRVISRKLYTSQTVNSAEFLISVNDHVRILDTIRVNLETYPVTFRKRTENNALSLFYDDLDQLYDFAAGPMQAHKSDLVLLSTVNQNELELLNQGLIILRKPIPYNYRVNLRSGYYRDPTNIIALANYIRQIPDEIKIGQQLLHGMIQGNKYLNGGYFYIRDKRILDIITLIHPTLIRSYQRIVFQ